MLVGARLKCIEAAGIGDDEPLASAHNSKADNSKGALASAHTSKADNSKANTGCSRAKSGSQAETGQADTGKANTGSKASRHNREPV